MMLIMDVTNRIIKVADSEQTPALGAAMFAAMMIIIITGEIDLSVGSVAAFTGAIAGVLLATWDLPVAVGIILCLLLGALIGAWQGFWVAYMAIPSFIVTLAE